MKIAGHEIGAGRALIVAELGINHNGSTEQALRLMDAAKAAGADLVKFQKRTVEIVYTAEELARPRWSSFGRTNGDLKRGLELDRTAYARIDAHARAIGLPWFASAWDVPSVAFLDDFEVPAHKVASACLTDLDLIRAMTRRRVPVLMSIGMSTPGEIDRAAGVVREGGAPLVLLVATACYPAPIPTLRLARITTLRAAYQDAAVGYSGHEVGVWTSYAARAMGAEVIERHLTLDRAAEGSDHAASLEPLALGKLVLEIHDFERASGDGALVPIAEEEPARAKLRRVRQ